MLVWLLNLVVDSVTHWFATTVLGLPRIQSRIQSRICSKDNSRLIQYKVKVIFFSKTGVHAAPFIRQTAKNYWSHASFAFVLWNLYAFQQSMKMIALGSLLFEMAIELWKTNMRHPQASEVVNKDIISHFVLRLSTAILQEATSQLPPETPIENIIVPKDADVQIVTEVLDQKFGRRHGKVVRCTGKAGVRETGASSSRLSTEEVNSLKEKVTTLRGQVAAQGDHIRAQDERMNMIVQALAMSGLQIPTMLAPNNLIIIFIKN
ncbi:hypothetical protein DVH24_020921 [Malus domestica]|uniref:Uncharacterized protein n=1 Tax=Malus domestica TaxID=3750 RepID=A0A498J886_MALDO|nr:hypothetical protein DVH24_020921 [Malus domestica]